MTSEKQLGRILYAEDEPDIQTIARFALVKLGGFDLEVCASGEEAVRKAPGFKPDLLLLDVMMPDMDGPAALEAIRQLPSLSEVPVIFMTAKIQAHEVDEYERLGAIGVIAKPFDPVTLAGQVREIWQQRRSAPVRDTTGG